MKKISILSVTALIVLTSCMKEPISTEIKGEFKVEFLFEKDGVKVYRFFDSGTHYFTSKGETMTTQASGKTHYEESIR